MTADFDFPSAWPYGYSTADVPGGGAILGPGQTAWPFPGSNPEDPDMFENPLCEALPVGDNPNFVEVQWPEVERESGKAVLLRWESRSGPKMVWVPFSQARVDHRAQRLWIADWLISKNNLDEFVAHLNPYEEDEETIDGASIVTNPLYPLEDEPDYEGIRVSYDIKDKPWPADTYFKHGGDIVEFTEKLGMFDDQRERLYAIYLDQKHKPTAYRLVSAGSLTEGLVHPREVFGPAYGVAAAAIVIVHNHPSGDPKPSGDDRRLLQRMKRIADLHGIRILDFVVVGRDGYWSAVDSGEL